MKLKNYDAVSSNWKGDIGLDPLLVDIPIQLETERLILRAPRQSGDGSIVNEAIKFSINELKAWLPFAQKTPTVEETEVSLRVAHINFLKRESLRYLIFCKGTNDFMIKPRTPVTSVVGWICFLFFVLKWYHVTNECSIW